MWELQVMDSGNNWRHHSMFRTWQAAHNYAEDMPHLRGYRILQRDGAESDALLTV